jgi:RNA polymerase sigma-70 factor (ECF subfamily)
VKAEDSSGDQGAGRFQTTHWSAVLLSAQSEAPGSRAALADLCKRYWYPIYSFVRRKGYNADDAQDLTQGFFLSLLDRKALSQVHPAKGKFRSFLLASLRNYLSDQFDRRHSLKRGKNIEFVSFDFQNGDERYLSEPRDALTAEKIFDARWAMILLDETLRRLRDEYAAQQKLTVFECLKPFLSPATKQTLPSYKQIADKLNCSLGRVKTLIHRLRKRYSELMREEVARTVTDPKDVDQEIHALCEALIAAEGRLSS